MNKPPTKWSFQRRSSYGVLERFIGQEINVFGPRSCEEHDNCLGGGFLVGIEDGFLLLAERPNEPPDLAVALSEMVVLAVVKDRPELTAVDGGKVQMPLTKTFFSQAFGVVADRFGVPWMVVAPE